MTLSRYDIEQLQSDLTDKLAKIEPTSAQLYPYGLEQLRAALKKESGKPSVMLRELGRLAKHTLEDFANVEHQEQVHPRYNVATCMIVTKGYDLQKAIKKSRTIWANAYEEALKQYPKSRVEVLLLKAAESLGIHDPKTVFVAGPGFPLHEGTQAEDRTKRGESPFFAHIDDYGYFNPDEELDKLRGKQGELSSEDILPTAGINEMYGRHGFERGLLTAVAPPTGGQPLKSMMAENLARRIAAKQAGSE